MSYKKNIKSTFITQIVIMLLGFIISVLVARALGPEGKGQVAYFMLFFGMIARFGNFGINDSLGYYIKKTNYDNEKIINNNFTFITLVVIFYMILFSFLYNKGLFLADFSFLLIVAGILYVYSNFLESNFKSIYMVKEKTYIQNNFKMKATLIKFLSIIFLYYFDLINVNIFILLNVFVFLFPVILMVRNLKFSFKFTIDKKLISSQLRYGFILYLSSAMIFLTYKVDQFMVEGYLGMSQLGVYSIGVQLAELVFIIPHSIIIPLRGKLFNMNNNSIEEREVITTTTTKLTMYVCSFLVIIGLILSPIIPFVYGKEFQGAIVVTIVLFIGVIFASIAKVAANFFYTEGITKIHLLITFIVLLINVALNWALIPLIGINGAAISSTIAYFFYGVLYIIIFVKRGNVKFKDFILLNKKDYSIVKSYVMKIKK